MDAQQRQTRQAIEMRLAGASREELVQALRDVLGATEEAQRPIDYGDYGVGGWRDHEAVQAERDVRVGVAEEVEGEIRNALGV
ncbi:hypothetical protein [Streptomyces qinglanensis]|uniref:hypothetical protein n=1 Tax=Streptomyces qinglanensis TaxID=943816 RepID=UPI003D73541B